MRSVLLSLSLLTQISSVSWLGEIPWGRVLSQQFWHFHSQLRKMQQRESERTMQASSDEEQHRGYALPLGRERKMAAASIQFLNQLLTLLILWINFVHLKINSTYLQAAHFLFAKVGNDHYPCLTCGETEAQSKTAFPGGYAIGH